MIWATVSSQSCFCWLYSFSTFGFKKYNQSDFSIDYVVMSMCRVISWVVGKAYLALPACSLEKTLLAIALLHFVLQGQTFLLFQVSLDFLLCIPIPYNEKDISIELVNFSFCSISCWGLDLDYCDEWFALEMNQDHSFNFEVVPKYCILDSFVDSEGYSISSKGFLLTVVNIMGIWIKFAHSHTF